MKYALVCALCVVAVIIIIAAIVPSLANLVTGLGIEIPSRFARSTESRFAHSLPCRAVDRRAGVACSGGLCVVAHCTFPVNTDNAGGPGL